MSQDALSADARRRLLREAIALARPGDLLFFYHRTSWRSRWIQRITACEMPHVCVYAGGGRIVGMLKGRVRLHPLRRFFRSGYEIRFVRGSDAVLAHVAQFVGRREVWLDLFVLAALVLLERALGPRFGRRAARYRMRGVTCSGVVSSAWHAAHLRPSVGDPMQHTPLDLERVVGKHAFFEANLTTLPELARPFVRAAGSRT